MRATRSLRHRARQRGQPQQACAIVASTRGAPASLRIDGRIACSRSRSGTYDRGVSTCAIERFSRSEELDGELVITTPSVIARIAEPGRGGGVAAVRRQDLIEDISRAIARTRSISNRTSIWSGRRFGSSTAPVCSRSTRRRLRRRSRRTDGATAGAPPARLGGARRHSAVASIALPTSVHARACRPNRTGGAAGATEQPVQPAARRVRPDQRVPPVQLDGRSPGCRWPGWR